MYSLNLFSKEEGRHEELMKKQGIYYRMVLSSLSEQKQDETDERDGLKIAVEGEMQQQQLRNAITTLDDKNKNDDERITKSNILKVPTDRLAIKFLLQHTTKTDWLLNLLGLFGSILLGLGVP